MNTKQKLFVSWNKVLDLSAKIFYIYCDLFGGAKETLPICMQNTNENQISLTDKLNFVLNGR
jgi:hypothetical protein